MQSIANVETYYVLDIHWIYKIYEYRVIFLQYTKFSFYHYSIFQFSLPVKSILKCHFAFMKILLHILQLKPPFSYSNFTNRFFSYNFFVAQVVNIIVVTILFSSFSSY